MKMMKTPFLQLSAMGTMIAFEEEYGLRPVLDQWQFDLVTKVFKPPKGFTLASDLEEFAMEKNTKWKCPFKLSRY